MNFSTTCKTWDEVRKKLQLDALKSCSTHELYEPMFLYVHHFSILFHVSWALDLPRLMLVLFCWTTHSHPYIADIKTRSRWHTGWGKFVRRHVWATWCVRRKSFSCVNRQLKNRFWIGGKDDDWLVATDRVCDLKLLNLISGETIELLKRTWHHLCHFEWFWWSNDNTTLGPIWLLRWPFLDF